MSLADSDPKRENEPYALPDVETLYVSERERFSVCNCQEVGWYWWTCFPGCLPNSAASGPFATEADALADARSSAGLCTHGTPEGEPCEECPAPELWVLEREPGTRLVFGWASADYRPPISAWFSRKAAEKAAESLGVKATAARLPDAEARQWGYAKESQ